MSKSNYYENAIIDHLFTNANIANIGDATGLRGSSTTGTLEFHLHTADPGEAGTTATSEATYGSYVLKTLARNNTNFTVSGNAVSLAANLDFDEATSGTQTLTHFSISGAGSTAILYSGTLTPNISVVTGVIPRLKAGQILTED